jgi:hypothetical protein
MVNYGSAHIANVSLLGQNSDVNSHYGRPSVFHLPCSVSYPVLRQPCSLVWATLELLVWFGDGSLPCSLSNASLWEWVRQSFQVQRDDLPY